jgi:hypothetical protein
MWNAILVGIAAGYARHFIGENPGWIERRVDVAMIDNFTNYVRLGAEAFTL